ncbi:Type IV pilus assembly PilZ [Candidatus Desulfosporosinus infrequens]|uniref:Type IV pilus assembly PilZ n=1 Tax=Candidatus Desulfosporosinus infrequens TaxID=2043169 RepID=A0A2U3KXG7_9FIRM|nr:Type IV pilus assembly PilZ [Candidatus Desulfosporosinus infrequens]
MSDFNEKRKYFRVDLLKEVSALAKISSVNDQVVEIDKIIPISLLDISAGGMRVRIRYDLPTKLIKLTVKFEFENEQYDLLAQVLRKTPNAKGNNEYGLKLLLTSQEQSRIVRSLNMYKIKNTKFRKVELDFKAQKYARCFVKFLEIIDGPAYLITENRLVVAANLKAHEKGVKLGERCYKTICNRNEICPYCSLDKAISNNDQVVKSEAFELGENCTARWLYTEDGLIMHYFEENCVVKE